MAIYALTGDDQIIINQVPLNDFPDGDIGTLSIQNTIAEMTTGKDANTIFALNEAGKNAVLTVRVLMGSSDDKRLNGLIPQTSRFASYSLVEGSIIKQIGDGAGNISYNTYMLSGGMVNKLPDVRINVNGDGQQAVVEYQIIFALASRAIQ
jgi:hypothetical protein